jgi:hypothetical protein
MLIGASLPAYAADFAFTAGVGFASGCATGGFSGTFQFQRNGVVGTLEFPATGAEFVLFQQDPNDNYHWSVRNREDEMAVDFSAGTLAYVYNDGRKNYRCEGTFARSGLR